MTDDKEACMRRLSLWFTCLKLNRYNRPYMKDWRLAYDLPEKPSRASCLLIEDKMDDGTHGTISASY